MYTDACAAQYKNFGMFFSYYVMFFIQTFSLKYPDDYKDDEMQLNRTLNY